MLVTINPSTNDGFVTGTDADYETAHGTATAFDIVQTGMRSGQVKIALNYSIYLPYWEFDFGDIVRQDISQIDLVLTPISITFADGLDDLYVLLGFATTVLGLGTMQDFFANVAGYDTIAFCNSSELVLNTPITKTIGWMEEGSPGGVLSKDLNEYPIIPLSMATMLQLSSTPPVVSNFAAFASMDYMLDVTFRPKLLVTVPGADPISNTGGGGVGGSAVFG